MGCPGGWIDFEDADPKVTCERELREEVGLEVLEYRYLHLLDVVSEEHVDLGVRTVTIYYTIELRHTWGTATLREPNKASSLKWFAPLDLIKSKEPKFPKLETVLKRLIERKNNAGLA